jgi:hypothetical protein
MGTSSKKHHYVPKLYLRQFATGADQITTVRLPGDVRYTSSVTDTGSENRFHTIPQNTANPEALEDAFSDLEDAAAPVLRSIESGTWPLSLDDRVTVGAFVTIQALRVPEQRRLMKSLQADMVEREKRQVTEHGAAQWFADHGVRVDDERAREEWQRVIDGDEPLVTIDAAYHAEQIATHADAVLPHLLARRWNLVRFDTPSLLTSDAPVSLHDASDGRPGRWGLLNAPTITVPLSRTTALLLADPVQARARIEVEAAAHGKFDSVAAGKAKDARHLNERTAHNAAQALFHHPDDEAIVPRTLPDPRE